MDRPIIQSINMKKLVISRSTKLRKWLEMKEPHTKQTFNDTNKFSIIHSKAVLMGKSLCNKGIPNDSKQWFQC